MRLVIDTLIAVMLAVVLVSIVVHDRSQQRLLGRYQSVHDALSRLQEQAVYHCSVAGAPVSEAGFPLDISPLWFSHHGLPHNAMLPGRQPWLDVAPAGDLNGHPPDPIALRPDQAGFWYNPNLGVIRARVPWEYDIHRAIEMYNQLNGSNLVSLPENDPLRRPRLAAMTTTADATSSKP